MKENKLKIFIDFDDVVFNTKKFVADYKNVFFSHGISPEKFEECYYDYPKKNGDGTISKYEFRGHLERLRIGCPEVDMGAVEKKVIFLLQNAEKYLFDDVKEFVLSLDGCDIKLISYGDAVFQREKINGSGIAGYVSDIVITDKMKSQAIAQFVDKKENQKLVFIDDRIEQVADVKKNFPQTATFLMKRPEGRYDDEFDAKFCDHEVHDLHEVADIIKEL